MLDNLSTPPTAKRLILSLLSAPSLPEVDVALLLRWGELFDIDAPSMRVSVARLVKQGLLASPRRGVYAIGPAGRATARRARSWRDAEAQTRDWQGDWLFAQVAHLGRVNRSAVRTRERALRLGGFAELRAGFWCRPANLAASPAQTRDQLAALGLESAALTGISTELLGTSKRELYALWPRQQLQRDYRKQLTRMRRSRSRVTKLALPEAARETLLIGESVIRQINSDPLLPSEMIDTELRHAMIAGMCEYDELGRGIWAQYISACRR